MLRYPTFNRLMCAYNACDSKTEREGLLADIRIGDHRMHTDGCGGSDDECDDGNDEDSDGTGRSKGKAKRKGKSKKKGRRIGPSLSKAVYFNICNDDPDAQVQ